MKKLILWETNSAIIPIDPAERAKLLQRMLEMTKADLESGAIEAWGISPSGSGGYSLTELDESKILAVVSKYQPYVKFKVKPMLSVDECISVVKEMQK